MTVDERLQRIRELIDDKERIDKELSGLIAGAEPPKRGRPKKQPEQGNGPDTEQPDNLQGLS